ncbi:MAG: hypothetical protein HRT58_00265 [Crocinitomicaceae bacterium]|nr:hypothetical protein [Flavobacteriales bacterium]NQZ34054.1 hypothetical protein [Crocinitomicaceae bacterium]
MKVVFLLLLLSVTSSVFAQSASGSPNARLEATGLKVGDRLHDSLEVYTADGNKVKLNDLFNSDNSNPTVIVSGCLTCPVFLRTYAHTEAVYLDYKDKVNFYFLYKILAHPENRGYIQAITIKERLAHTVEAKETLKTTVPWLADPMTNEVSSAFGLTPNSEFLFDSTGQILYMKAWSDANELRKALTEAVGPSLKTTSAGDLNLPKLNFTNTGKNNLVTRISVEENLIPITVLPIDSTTHYVKLRAEVTHTLMEEGSGKIYLGFHLDPIHKVHWNNLVDPLAYTITVPDGITIEEAKMSAPKVEQIEDTEPREFFIEVKNWEKNSSLPIEVVYYACDEENQWCKLVVQNYILTLESDKYAGGVIGRSFRAGSQQNQATGNRRGKGKGSMIDRIMSFDKNEDGYIDKSEAPERMLARFDQLDSNKDGRISREEISHIKK